MKVGMEAERAFLAKSKQLLRGSEFEVVDRTQDKVSQRNGVDFVWTNNLDKTIQFDVKWDKYPRTRWIELGSDFRSGWKSGWLAEAKLTDLFAYPDEDDFVVARMGELRNIARKFFDAACGRYYEEIWYQSHPKSSIVMENLLGQNINHNGIVLKACQNPAYTTYGLSVPIDLFPSSPLSGLT
jgi:hypothetical protein